MKGGIYAEQFRSLADIKTISDRAEERVREYGERDTQRELAGAKQELEKYVQYKHGELRDRYSKPTREVGAELHQDKELDNHNLDRTREHERSDTNNVVLETSRESSSTREHHTRTTADTLQRGREPQSDTREQELTRTERNPREQNQTATSREQETQRVEHTRLQPRNDTERQEVDANERSDEGREWQKLGISREIKGESTNGNRIRTDATRRAREREEAQRFFLQQLKSNQTAFIEELQRISRVYENELTKITQSFKEELAKNRALLENYMQTEATEFNALQSELERLSKALKNT